MQSSALTTAGAAQTVRNISGCVGRLETLPPPSHPTRPLILTRTSTVDSPVRMPPRLLLAQRFSRVHCRRLWLQTFEAGVALFVSVSLRSALVRISRARSIWRRRSARLCGQSGRRSSRTTGRYECKSDAWACVRPRRLWSSPVGTSRRHQSINTPR